ncbi:MAG: hypothetical protein R3B06_27905 [Kofleriaceae bacterium]
MKLTVIALLTLSLTTAACKKKDEAAGPPAAKPVEPGAKPTEPAPPPAPVETKMVPLDLAAVGEEWAGWSVMAPEGATVKESFGNAQISMGGSFQVDLGKGEADVASFKKEVDGNDVNKVKRYLVDQPDAILYESEVMGQTEFHLFGAVKVGEDTFSCEDVKGPPHTQAEVETMWKICQSITKK